MTARNIHYERADRVRGLSAGGIGAASSWPRRSNSTRRSTAPICSSGICPLESDHVLNIAFNVLAGGKHIEHLELRRHGRGLSRCSWEPNRSRTRRPPGTSAVRFSEADVLALIDAINESRLQVWAQQPDEFSMRRSWTPMAPSWRPMPSASWSGHRLRPPVGLPSSALGLAGQYGGALFLLNRSLAPIAPRRSGPASTSTRRSRSACGPASARSCCGETRGSPRTRTWIAGTIAGPPAGRHDDRRGRGPGLLGRCGEHPLHLRICGLRRPQGQEGPTRCQTRPLRLPGTHDRRDMQSRPRHQQPERVKPMIIRERLQDDPSARGADRRVRLSAGRLQEELSDDRAPQAAGDRPSRCS